MIYKQNSDNCSKVIKKQKVDASSSSKSKKISPSGISMNFQQQLHQSKQLDINDKDIIEITIGATGMKQKSYSRLSRHNFVRYALSCDKLLQKLNGSDNPLDDVKEDSKQRTYQELKEQKVPNFLKDVRCVIFLGESNGPLKGWLSNSESNDFTIKYS